MADPAPCTYCSGPWGQVQPQWRGRVLWATGIYFFDENQTNPRSGAIVVGPSAVKYARDIMVRVWAEDRKDVYGDLDWGVNIQVDQGVTVPGTEYPLTPDSWINDVLQPPSGTDPIEGNYVYKPGTLIYQEVVFNAISDFSWQSLVDTDDLFRLGLFPVDVSGLGQVKMTVQLWVNAETASDLGRQVSTETVEQPNEYFQFRMVDLDIMQPRPSGIAGADV